MSSDKTTPLGFPDIPITLTSANATDSSNPANFECFFYDKLMVEGQYVLAFDGLSCWYSWTNISAEQGNNIIAYQNGDSNWKTLTIPDGQWNVEGLNQLLQALMLENGDTGVQALSTQVRYELLATETNEQNSFVISKSNLSSTQQQMVVKSLQNSVNASGDPIYYIDIIPNYNTGYVNVQVSNGFSLDLSQSSIWKLLGFNSGTILTSQADLWVAPNLADIANGFQSMIVSISIVTGSFLNGVNGPYVYSFAPIPGETPNSQIVRTSLYPRWVSIVPDRVDRIERIRVQFLDQNGKVMNFRGAANDTTISFTLRKIV